MRIAPIQKNRVPIPIAEINNDSLRPNDSTKKKMKRVVAATWMHMPLERRYTRDDLAYLDHAVDTRRQEFTLSTGISNLKDREHSAM